MFVCQLVVVAQAECLCIMQVVLGLIPGGNQIFLILYCFFKKACERERTHLMAKKIPNFLLVKVEALKVKGAY